LNISHGIVGLCFFLYTHAWKFSYFVMKEVKHRQYLVTDFFMLLISCHRSSWGFFCSWNFVTNTKYHSWRIPFSFQYFGTSWKNYRSLPTKLPLILAVSLFFREIITVSLSRRDNTTVLCIYSWVLYSSIIFLFKSIVSYSWLLSIYYIP